MRKDYICGLDIGTSKICATCARVGPCGKIDILGSQTTPTQGMKAGRITDSKKVSACVRETMEKLRKICGFKVRRVYANIDSPDLRAKLCEKIVSFGERTELKESHIERLVDSCISSNVSLDRKVIYTGFRNFRLDNKTDCIYPEGHCAYEVKLNIVLVTAPIRTIKSFINCVRTAGLVLEDIAPSGCAQARSLFKDSKQGSRKNDILIDVGGGLTKIFLLKEKAVKDMAILPQGAQNITEALAAGLKLSFNCAEQLKLNYGRAHYENSPLTQRIIVKAGRIIELRRLSEIIVLKVDGLLQEIKKTLLKLNCEDKKIAEIIITGGGSIMEGFLERAEKVLGKPVKMGFLFAVKDSHIQTQSALFATSIGLIQLGLKNRPGKKSFARLKSSPLIYTLNRTRQLYREYF